MRRVVLALITTVFCVHLAAGLVHADGMILPELLSPDYLVVRSHHVTVGIEENHAVTRVEQEFHNPHPFPVGGRYLFPVPPDAILSRFQAMVDGRPQSVTRQDVAATNAALYDVVAQRRDPSLLQYADWESLAFDLNLPAGGSRRMSLEYEEVLTPSGGLYRYRYVLSTERYSSQPLEQVSLTIDLRSSSGLSSLYSSTHPVTLERQGPGRARVAWQAENVHLGEDFELFFAPAEGGFGGGLLTGRREGHDHLMFLFAPETEADPAGVLPKDIVFVVDRSGSMSGEKITQARDALRYILDQLNPEDRFSIVGFDHRLSILSPTLLPVADDTLTDARRFVDVLAADGNTDLEGAMRAGLEILGRSESGDASRTVVFLTDGLPTEGVTDEDLISRLVAEANTRVEARTHVFGVGYDVNTHLLDRLAADNGGSVTYVQPGESLEAVLTGFYRRIAHPVLTDVEITFEGLEASRLYPEKLPDLFQGSSLLLVGRYQATAPTVTVRVNGRAGGEEREYVYDFDLDEPKERGHDFVPRLWATRRVGELMDRVRVEGARPDLVDEIRELGLAYGLVTPYTSYVIQAQADGAASASNMALYANLAQLNQASGQTTVQARVQNQLYQQAVQADLASGANVINQGQHTLAQIAGENVDLALIRDQNDLDAPISPEWIARNVHVDVNIRFGSEAYFDLAADPAARAFLQSGANVVFVYNGDVISVQDAPSQDVDQPEPVYQASMEGFLGRILAWLRELYEWLVY